MLRGKLVKGAVSILRASFDFWAQAASVIVYAKNQTPERVWLVLVGIWRLRCPQ